MITSAVAAIAGQCRHCSMCKIDCLGTGLCPGGVEHGFASCWPLGRMDIVRFLAAGRLPFSAGLLRAAGSCTLCGACDLQCHFTTGLRPLEVMRALKEHLAGLFAAGEAPSAVAADPFVSALAAALPLGRVSNDPADLACSGIFSTYSHAYGTAADNFVVVAKGGKLE